MAASMDIPGIRELSDHLRAAGVEVADVALTAPLINRARLRPWRPRTEVIVALSRRRQLLFAPLWAALAQWGQGRIRIFLTASLANKIASSRQLPWLLTALRVELIVPTEPLVSALRSAGLTATRLLLPRDGAPVATKPSNEIAGRVLIDPRDGAEANGVVERAIDLVRQKYPRAAIICSCENPATIDADIYVHASTGPLDLERLHQIRSRQLVLIATPHGISDGRAGAGDDCLVIPPLDHIGLADVIVQLIEAPDIAAALIRRGLWHREQSTWRAVRRGWLPPAM